MSSITSVFHPFLTFLADIVAFFYGLVHDYSFAIALLTILVYLILTPLLVKQTRSMIQMQKLQPEMRKLQQKYKGRDLESKQKLQEEMMALYREHGVNPMSGCLSALPQFVVLGVMYAVIRGLLNLKAKGHQIVLVKGLPVSQPRYVSHSSALYKNLVAAHGKMLSMGVDLAKAPNQHHGSFGTAVPFYILLVGAVGLSFLQLQQMTIRNRKIMEQTPQMRQMQRMQTIMPLVMIFIYWRLPAVLCVYFIVSSVFRIVQQEMMYRFDPVLVAHVDAALSRTSGTRRAQRVAGQPGPARDGAQLSAGAKGRGITPPRTVPDSQAAEEAGEPSKPDLTAERMAQAEDINLKERLSDEGAKKVPTAKWSGPRGRGQPREPESPASSVTAEIGGEERRPHPRSKSKRPRKAR